MQTVTVEFSNSTARLTGCTAQLAQRRSLAGELTLSCARPSDVGKPSAKISQLGQLSLSSFRGQYMSSELQLDVRHLNQWRRHLVNAYEVKEGIVFIAGKTV